MRVHHVRALVIVVCVAMARSVAAQPGPFLEAAPPLPVMALASSAREMGFYTDGYHEGDNYYQASDAPLPGPGQPEAVPPGPVSSSFDGFDCPEFCARCEGCPTRGLVLFSGIDSWHGIADRLDAANRPGNNDGGSLGANFGTSLGRVSEMTGLGFQFGASYGVYDWNGRPFNPGVLTTTRAQQQVFVTTGFFKKADDCSAVSYGLVHDWMINQQFGSQAVNPTLGQWRAQVAYATSAWNEYGAWGTWRDKGSTNVDALGDPVSFRAINQVDFFWHHKWALKADSWIWVGWPQDSRLNVLEGGSLGNLLIGGSIIAPLNNSTSLYANMQYMHPSATPGNAAFGESSWYVAFGLQYYIGGSARTDTVAGQCWLPYLPMANNGNFLVDSAPNGPI